MSIALIVFLALLGALVLYGIMIYNNLVSLKHAVSKAWSNIDVLLKQRHDELPKLVETCRLWGRIAARIDPEWVEPVAQHAACGRMVAPYRHLRLSRWVPACVYRFAAGTPGAD